MAPARRGPQAWESAAPIQRSVGEMPLTAPRFDDALSAWQRPQPFLGPLGHAVSPAAPVGLVDGLATVVSPIVTHDDGEPLTYAEPGGSRQVSARSASPHSWTSASLPEPAPPRVLGVTAATPAVQRLRTAPEPEPFRAPLPIVGAPAPPTATAPTPDGDADTAPLVGAEPAAAVPEPGPLTLSSDVAPANAAPAQTDDPAGLILGRGTTNTPVVRRHGLGAPLRSVPSAPSADPGAGAPAVQREPSSGAPTPPVPPSTTGEPATSAPLVGQREPLGSVGEPLHRGDDRQDVGSDEWSGLPAQRGAGAGPDAGATGKPAVRSGPPSSSAPPAAPASPPTAVQRSVAAPTGTPPGSVPTPPPAVAEETTPAPLVGQREPLGSVGEPLHPSGDLQGEAGDEDHGEAPGEPLGLPVPPGAGPTRDQPVQSASPTASATPGSPPPPLTAVQRSVAAGAPGLPLADPAEATPASTDDAPMAPVIGAVAPLVDAPAPLPISRTEDGTEPVDGEPQAPLPLQRDTAGSSAPGRRSPGVDAPASGARVMTRTLSGSGLAPERSAEPTAQLLTGRTGMVQRALRLAAPLTATGSDGWAAHDPGVAVGTAAGSSASSRGPDGLAGPPAGAGPHGTGPRVTGPQALGTHAAPSAGPGAVTAQRQQRVGSTRTPTVRARWQPNAPLQGGTADPVTAQTLREDERHHGHGSTTAQPAVNRSAAGVAEAPATGGQVRTAGHDGVPGSGGRWHDAGRSTGPGAASRPGPGTHGTNGTGGAPRTGPLPLAQVSLPTAVQRSLATAAATPTVVDAPAPIACGAMPPPAVVQRRVEIDEMTTTAVPGPTGAGPEAGPEGEPDAPEADVHALAAKLYRPLRNRLMNELRIDRERNGLTTERRR